MSARLRLWPAALAAWVATLLALPGRWPGLVLLGLVVAGAIGGVLAWQRPSSRRLARVAALAWLAALAAAGGAAVRGAALVSPLLPEPGTLVIVTGVLDTDPRIVQGRVNGIVRGPPRVVAALTAEQLTWSDGAVAGRVPVRWWAPVAAAGMLPGTRVAGRARVQPGDPASGAALTLTMTGDPEVVEEPPAWQVAAGALRAGLRAAVADDHGPGAGLLPGLVLGDESTLPAGLADDMRTAGLSHLTVVSGANVSVILGAVLVVIAAVRVPRRWRALPAVLALVAFVAVVRPSPSVVRAAGMGGVGILALVVGGRRQGASALAAAVLALLLLDPWLAGSMGFALSAAATGGLLLLAPRLVDLLCDWFPRLPLAVAQALSVTLAAQVTTLPLLLLIGSPVGLGAVPANLLAEPLVAPATVLGVLATLLAPLSLPLARVVALPAVWCSDGIAAVATAVANWVPLPLPWPSGPAGAAGAALVLGACALGVRHRRWLAPRLAALPRGPVAACVAAGAVAVATLPRTTAPWPPEGWVAVACDVGQGDALVLRAGEGEAVVVDAGPLPAAIDRCLADLGVERVDALVLSHFHADHVEGVPGVLRRRSVGVVLVSPLADPPDEVERVQRWCDQAQVPVQVVTAGDARAAGAVSWRTVWPDRLLHAEGSAPNNASLTLVAEVSGVTLLLAGDIEPAAQAALMRVGGLGRVDVLKVPHHGSRRQHPRFLGWVSARAALVSVGAGNDYGHPAPETMAALATLGIPALRTDLSGDVAVVRTDAAMGLIPRAQAP